MLIDSHAHLEMKDFDADRDRVIARALAAGVSHIITVATTISDVGKALAIAQKNESVYVAIGIHPHEAKDISDGDYDQLRSLANEKKVVAFGEIGLDFYRNHSPREIQLTRFRELLRLGKDLGLPIILHDRDAHRVSDLEHGRGAGEPQPDVDQLLEERLGHDRVWAAEVAVRERRLLLGNARAVALVHEEVARHGIALRPGREAGVDVAGISRKPVRLVVLGGEAPAVRVHA